ncbi:dephospho-CoA kinase [Peptoanaerobacter stomatis]|uniref:Dephospho-CoA kinase n=1 Tax=Peptoanaerobacter stomatis TaxID=796937 RepID=G9XAQ6_9FIRM|nr:dephospho-CoA kinase [Peptoanaerobacter stomatis]EHL19900.1 dephospho-CoA kinase [Peptoanaerobacter stomatis]
MRIVGITGSIASGKSEVSKYISSKGYKITDADYISRNITKKGNIGYKVIIDNFGNVIDESGEIDRKKLSNMVFNDSKQLEKLNSLLHPLIFKEIDKNIKSFNNEKTVFLDAPLLFETMLYKKCDEIILIYCDEETQIQRIILRDNTDEEKARLIIEKQMSVEEKMKKSNYIVENNTTLDKLHFKIDEVLNMIIRD